MPVLGIGLRPTIAALFLYRGLPTIRNTLEGLATVTAEVVGAARAGVVGAAREAP